MATSKEYHDYVVDKLSAAGNIRTRKMMGEYLVYYNEKLIGNICDNTLYVKKTDSSGSLLADYELDYPYEGSKTLMYVVNDLDGIDFIQDLLEGMYPELPAPKKKKKK